jgi:hypothetical protein
MPPADVLLAAAFIAGISVDARLGVDIIAHMQANLDDL